MAIAIRLIVFVLFAVEMFYAFKEKRKHNYVDSFWHMGWAIIWYIAVT